MRRKKSAFRDSFDANAATATTRRKRLPSSPAGGQEKLPREKRLHHIGRSLVSLALSELEGTREPDNQVPPALVSARPTSSHFKWIPAEFSWRNKHTNETFSRSPVSPLETEIQTTNSRTFSSCWPKLRVFWCFSFSLECCSLGQFVVMIFAVCEATFDFK